MPGKNVDFLSLAAWILFALSVVMILGRYALGYKASAWLKIKDFAQSNQIIPHKIGIVSRGIIFSPAMISVVLTGIREDALLPILIILGIFILFISFHSGKMLATTARLEADVFVVAEKKTVNRIPVSDIISVSWENTDMPFCVMLVICVQGNKRFSFRQDDFWGLNNMYAKLTAALEQQTENSE